MLQISQHYELEFKKIVAFILKRSVTLKFLLQNTVYHMQIF